MKSPIQLFAAIAILLATATVAAQVYKWVDKDGKVQYSDQAPPASATRTEAKKVETSPAAASVPDTPGKALQDRAKAYDKRQKDAADKAKKNAETQKSAEVEETYCKAAQAALRDMESGRPIKRGNEQGESVFMSDEEKQAEATKARAAVAKSCKE